MDLPAVEHRLSLTGETPAPAVFAPMLMEGVELEAALAWPPESRVLFSLNTLNRPD